MMNAKRSVSLKGLLFRELYMGRSTYTAVTGIFFGIVVLCVLVLLSMKFGNLAKLPADVTESARGTVRSVAIYIPAAIFFMNASVVVDTAPHDYNERWMRFLYSSPVSEGLFMGIKYAFVLAVAAAGYGLSSVSGMIMGAIMGEPMSYTDFAVISLIMLVVVFMAVVITVLSFLLRSTVFAVIIALVGGYIVMVVLILSNDERLDRVAAEEGLAPLFEGVPALCESIFPFSPLILLAVIAAGWGASTLILKKRDRKIPQLFSKKNAAEKGV